MVLRATWYMEGSLKELRTAPSRPRAGDLARALGRR
jgi:hypothetical protein